MTLVFLVLICEDLCVYIFDSFTVTKLLDFFKKLIMIIVGDLLTDLHHFNSSFFYIP